MIVINTEILLQNEFFIHNIVSNISNDKAGVSFSYLEKSRVKNLLLFQVTGKRKYEFENKNSFILSENDWIFLPDGCKYISTVIEGDENENSVGYGISFDFLNAIGEKMTLQPKHIVFNNAPEYIKQSFKSIISLQGNSFEDTIKKYKYIYMLLEKSICNKSEGFDIIKPALEYINLHLEQGKTNKELADMCFLSESTFRKIFLEYSGGISIQKYIMNIRINKVMEMAASNIPVEEIANMLGFCDSSHLCKTYKKYTGKNIRKK